MKLGLVDLEIISLGIAKNGTFDENDIAKSDLKRLGVGRILDFLAILKDKKLLDLNQDGSFSITDSARQIMWDSEISTSKRILKLLEIKPLDIEKIADILCVNLKDISENIEELRKKGYVLMSPLRKDDKLIKMYEITPDGIDQTLKDEKLTLINDIINYAKKSNLDSEIVIKLNKLKMLLGES